jgi:hypothetical protein
LSCPKAGKAATSAACSSSAVELLSKIACP